MNALFIANDRNLFEEGSEVQLRMQQYAEAIGTLHVLSRSGAHASFVQRGSLFLHPLKGSLLDMIPVARALIAEHSIEIVSAQDPFEYGWIASRAIVGTDAKLHIQIHTDFLSPWFTKAGGFRSPRVPVPLLNFVRRYIADRVLPKASGIRVVSERIKNSLKERYGDALAPIAVIPIAVSAIVPPPVPLPPHDFAFALITVARLEPEKRIEDILYAIARIRFDYPSVGLFVVGAGSESGRLKRLAKKLGLSDRVVFIEGWRTDAWSLMQSAQAYIQASAYEGYGRTLVEAALARLPIITTDVGIVGEVFAGYKEVLSAPVADPAALAVHIRGLVDDHQARALLALEAEKTARAHVEGLKDQPQRVARDLFETLERA